MFPFLIGTVRTRQKVLEGIPINPVSIPHRYGKNQTNVSGIQTDLRFPFLIGTVRTIHSFGLSIYLIEVSIPHRYGKNNDKFEYQYGLEPKRFHSS